MYILLEPDLHDLVEVLHILPRHGLHVLAPEAVLHQQLVKLLDFVTSSESS